MPGFRLVVDASSLTRAQQKLYALMDKVKRPQPAMRAASIWLYEQTMRAFEDGGRPEAWAPLHVMTLFIRAHRASAPRRGGGDALPLNDTGRLKGSFIPVIADDDTTFGVSTNVEYAPLMQKGGVSEENDVSISGFTRSRRNAQGRDYSRGKLTRARTGKIKDYILHMKAGNEIEARPFFPEGMAELRSWGYTDKIREIFALYFKDAYGGDALGGTA